MSEWKKLSEEIVHKNPFYYIRKEAFETPMGQKGDYYIVEKPEFSTVVPVNEEGELGLIYMYRYTTKTYSQEFPAGAFEEGDDSLYAAKRELLEETGITAESIDYLGYTYCANGMAKMKGHFFSASDLSFGEDVNAEEEGIEKLEFFTEEQVSEMIKENVINDETSVAAFAKYILNKQLILANKTCQVYKTLDIFLIL